MVLAPALKQPAAAADNLPIAAAASSLAYRTKPRPPVRPRAHSPAYFSPALAPIHLPLALAFSSWLHSARYHPSARHGTRPAAQLLGCCSRRGALMLPCSCRVCLTSLSPSLSLSVLPTSVLAIPSLSQQFHFLQRRLRAPHRRPQQGSAVTANSGKPRARWQRG